MMAWAVWIGIAAALAIGGRMLWKWADRIEQAAQQEEYERQLAEWQRQQAQQQMQQGGGWQ